ncbi:methylmalonyl-CoA epimerase-like protein, putative [Bodo saltans]|uniref:Methylmalonyl-CoA epimerase, mitochondrial n=1 Tax=Bodo saltans TaxID=75058 RepID=A0A0S4INE6_BODSA|nr:methylmalonyl-CoA epimerase-like protein, putative [Bodo saltans]|eukprot:CUE86307.1 methylmalonyl-CoA epimerase-like protein, putative [Bodo saltans]
MIRASRLCRFANPLPFGRLNHVAIAVPKSKPILEAAAMYKNLFNAKVSDAVDLPDHGVTTVFVELPNTKLELLHPFGEKSPIQGFLDKNPGGGMHHICIEVENIEESIAKCKAANIRTIGDKPKIGAHNKPVIFLHPKDCGGVLVEMEQV